MVKAYHVIVTYYGFWLPNDPRGSWSDFVGQFELYRYGPATRVHDGRSRAADRHDRRRRMEAKTALPRPPVRLSGEQARDVALGFAASAAEDGLTLHAAAVMPEHAHLVVGRGGRAVEHAVKRMKAAATRRLSESGRHPFVDLRRADGSLPKLFARGCWKVFLDSDAAVARAEDYAEANPEKEGLPRQRWTFVRRRREMFEAECATRCRGDGGGANLPV